MGFQTTQFVHKPRLLVPMYGLSSQALPDAALVLNLQYRFDNSPATLEQDFTLNAPLGSGLYMYFAYPVSMGLAQFLDVESQFVGGWDGAFDNPYEQWGPETINVTVPSGEVVPFYVYRTDYSELGSVHWQSSPAP